DHITLAATGATARAGNPCFSIADAGDGQVPRRWPDTLLSLNRSNKLRTLFVQGAHNQGGTGALRFCGRHGLELIVSRRNPTLVARAEHPSDLEWGFTIVRREDAGAGRRSSVYTYLAPVGAEQRPGRGDVLSFRAETLPIFPQQNQPYARPASHGTLIKLYAYGARGRRSNTLMRDG